MGEGVAVRGGNIFRGGRGNLFSDAENVSCEKAHASLFPLRLRVSPLLLAPEDFISTLSFSVLS